MLKYITYTIVVLAIVALSTVLVNMRNTNLTQAQELEKFQQERQVDRSKIAGLLLDLEEERTRNTDLAEINTSLTKSLEKVTEINNNLEETLEENETLNDKNKELETELQSLKSSKEKVKTKAITLSNHSPKGKGRLLGTFEVTAYTDNVASQEEWVGQTASGMKPGVGVVAVDPKVIPLHTKLYVEGYGECVAGDVGGAIKGNMVDVFFNTASECKTWGRKQAKVYILD